LRGAPAPATLPIVLDLLEHPTRREAFARFACPAPLPGGYAPEERVVIGGIGWERHLALDEALGHDRPGPRFYYLDGDLEIMSTSDEHERINERIGNCMYIFFEECAVRDFARGQATMRLAEHTGAEPDKSWCFDVEKKYPDLVLEIALSSGGLPKLEIYRRFAIPEVWIWRRGHLEVHCLRPDGSGYQLASASRLLPSFPIAALEAAVAERDPMIARRDSREALKSL
jgi:Uma2 family endonuclease